MKSILLSTFLCVLLVIQVNAQDSISKPVKRMKVTDVFVQTGLFTEKGGMGSLEDFKTLAPNSILLNNDFTGFSSGNGFVINTNSMFSFNLGMRFSDKEKTKFMGNPLLKMGVSYLNLNTLGTYYYKNEMSRGDTLTASQSGQVIYVDTINTTNYWMDYSSDQIRLDVSLVFSTNTEARWSLYTGMGFTAGISVNSKTYISHGDYTRADYYNPSTNTTYSENLSTYAGSSETFRNKSNFGASIFLPMGVDFRIGKKNEFWKHIHLFYDIRPGLNIMAIPELGTFANVSIQHGLGFRYSW